MTEAFAMQGHRAHMEDRFCMLAEPKRDLYLYGVFDGHGGRVCEITFVFDTVIGYFFSHL